MMRVDVILAPHASPGEVFGFGLLAERLAA
jgi:hypothetical protein